MGVACFTGEVEPLGVRAIVLDGLEDSCKGAGRVSNDLRGCRDSEDVGLVGEEDNCLEDVD